MDALPELSGTVEAELDFLIYQPETAFAIVDEDVPDGYTPVTVNGGLIEGEEAHLAETRLTVRFRFSADTPLIP